jgi:hypothetical protein
MDRTLKSPSLKPPRGETLFLLPGALEAEPWEVWIGNGKEKSRCARTCSSPQENPWLKRSTLVLPVAQVFCLPLWLNETEVERLPDMIKLQLESRGLAGPEGNPTIYQWEIAARVENRTLVLVGLLPALLPDQLKIDSYSTFDVSARYFPWPENALTIWQEQGRLAAVFTRGKSVVYFQSLGEEHCSDRTAQTLICLLASLEIQQVLEGLSGVEIWADLKPEELALLKNALALPTRQTECPSPVPPAPDWNLCPPEVSRSKKEHQARRWKGRALLIALAVYVLIVAFLLGQFFLTAARLRNIQTWQAQHQTTLDSIQLAQADWQRLEPVVNTNGYPLEILLHCAEAIPIDQLHLTLFEVDDGKVQLKGEASNVAAAYVFLDRLKAQPQLAAYTWKMGEPHLLPNDLAQLEIEGTRATANP